MKRSERANGKGDKKEGREEVAMIHLDKTKLPLLLRSGGAAA